MPAGLRSYGADTVNALNPAKTTDEFVARGVKQESGRYGEGMLDLATKPSGRFHLSSVRHFPIIDPGDSMLIHRERRTRRSPRNGNDDKGGVARRLAGTGAGVGTLLPGSESGTQDELSRTHGAAGHHGLTTS